MSGTAINRKSIQGVILGKNGFVLERALHSQTANKYIDVSYFLIKIRQPCTSSDHLTSQSVAKLFLIQAVSCR